MVSENQNHNKNSPENPYEDPILVARSQGNPEYLSRLVAEQLARDRVRSMVPDDEDLEYLLAQEHARDMAEVVFTYELEHGYTAMPDNPEGP